MTESTNCCSLNVNSCPRSVALEHRDLLHGDARKLDQLHEVLSCGAGTPRSAPRQLQLKSMSSASTMQCSFATRFLSCLKAPAPRLGTQHARRDHQQIVPSPGRLPGGISQWDVRSRRFQKYACSSEITMTHRSRHEQRRPRDEPPARTSSSARAHSHAGARRPWHFFGAGTDTSKSISSHQSSAIGIVLAGSNP